MIIDDLIEPARAFEVLRGSGLRVSAAEPTDVRHKADGSALITFRLTLPDARQTWGYVRRCSSTDRAAEIHAKSMGVGVRPSPIEPAIIRLDATSIFYGFPNDTRLRRLRWYTDPRKLKRTLEPLTAPGDHISASRSTVEILRYKPERRVVSRVRLHTARGDRRDLVVRYSIRRQAQLLARIADRLLAYGVITPRPVAQLDRDAVSVVTHVPGPTLETRDGVGLADPSDLAQAITRFHATPAPAGIARSTPVMVLAHARRTLRQLVERTEVIRPLARRLSERLAETTPGDGALEALLHGDLHVGNLLRDPAGRIVFLDLERVATGPREADFGNLLAHSEASDRLGHTTTQIDDAEAVVDAYRSSGPPLDDGSLAWHSAIGLVDQAGRVARNLFPDWPTVAHDLLSGACERLERRKTPRMATP